MFLFKCEMVWRYKKEKYRESDRKAEMILWSGE